METSNNGMQESMAERARENAEERLRYAKEFVIECFQNDIYTYPAKKLELRPGVFNPDFDKLLWKHDVISAGFITAWNPVNEQLWDRENELLNYKLSNWLADYKKGVGFVRGKDDHRKASKGYFVFGISKRHLRMLGTKYIQAAVLYVGRGKAPEVVFTKYGLKGVYAVSFDCINRRNGVSTRFAKECNERDRTPRIVLNFGRPRN